MSQNFWDLVKKTSKREQIKKILLAKIDKAVKKGDFIQRGPMVFIYIGIKCIPEECRELFYEILPFLCTQISNEPNEGKEYCLKEITIKDDKKIIVKIFKNW